MSILPDSWLIHQVVIVKPVYSGSNYGATVPDYDAGTRTTLAGRLQQDRQTEKFGDARNSEEQNWTLFVKTDGVIDADCRVEWAARSLTFEVHGQPEPAYGVADYDHTEATLRILEG